MNEFVNYLNLTNNAGSDSTGSLAEVQVKSAYYDRIKVDRRLGGYIAEGLERQRYEAFVLTGHAGDGKTSILVQALKQEGLLAPTEGLEKQKDYEHFYYVKDMSEIPKHDQTGVLRKALESPANGKSSLLISNTGPLMDVFVKLVQEIRAEKGSPFGEDERIELQSTLLRQLDRSGDAAIEIEGYSFVLVNIARVDNVAFAGRILENILADDLWAACDGCACEDRCPICWNRRYVSEHRKRVLAFLENYYRYLYENDKRMTIRQMVGQISYALTGNLTCDAIQGHYYRAPFFDYNFANLFFGCVGLRDDKDAGQVKGIEQIRSLELDKIALDADYSLFVNHDYTCFSPEIQTELTELFRKNRRYYRISEEGAASSNPVQKRETQLRRAVRRFYLMYSMCSDEAQMEQVMNQVFGRHFTDYKKLISGRQPRLMLKRMQNTIFQALYKKNTGFLPSGDMPLFLTLRREDDVFQNVMLVLGTVNKSDLELCQRKENNRFEDADEKWSLVLKVKDREFPITLPLLTYFSALIDGAIASNSNPALTHGIAKLDALLHELYSFHDDDNELTVLVNTAKGQQVRKIAFEEGKMLID
ncbi:hypothetical protein [Ligaoa zhengdingensis]|uniref:hypothetical protein n=1 Tax=Ligaoa zhengdingensis TaxID=2763658 RepID=UPI0031B9B226